jgi:hypothetical protein
MADAVAVSSQLYDHMLAKSGNVKFSPKASSLRYNYTN